MQERAAAYVRVNAHGSASKAELAFMVELATSSELAQVWNDLMARETSVVKGFRTRFPRE